MLLLLLLLLLHLRIGLCLQCAHLLLSILRLQCRNRELADRRRTVSLANRGSTARGDVPDGGVDLVDLGLVLRHGAQVRLQLRVFAEIGQGVKGGRGRVVRRW